MMRASLRVERRFGSNFGVDGDFLVAPACRFDLQGERHTLPEFQWMREPGQDDMIRSGSENDRSTCG